MRMAHGFLRGVGLSIVSAAHFLDLMFFKMLGFSMGKEDFALLYRKPPESGRNHSLNPKKSILCRIKKLFSQELPFGCR